MGPIKTNVKLGAIRLLMGGGYILGGWLSLL
jgi:hypothetical protein